MATKEEIESYVKDATKKIKQTIQDDPNAAKKIQRRRDRIESTLLSTYGVDPSKLDDYLRIFDEDTEQPMGTMNTYANIKNAKFKLFVNNRSVPKDRIIEKKLRGNKIEIDVKEEDEADLRKRIQTAITFIGIDPETAQQQILLDNAKLLLDELSEAAKYRKVYVRPKQIRVDSYLGGLSLKKQANRKDIYDYWENVSKLYEEVWRTLEVLVEIAYDESEISDELKELKKFNEGDLSYVLELEGVSVIDEEPLALIKKYLLTVAGLYSVQEDYKKLMTGVDIPKLFEGRQVQAPTYAQLEFGEQGRVLGELPSATDDSFDNRVEERLEGTPLWADPLLAYYASKGNTTLYVKKKYDEVLEYLEGYISLAQQDMDGEDLVSLSPSIKEEILNASDAFIDDRETYHLPNSVLEDPIFATIGKYNTLKEADTNANIVSFLRAVGSLLWSIEPTFPSRSPKKTIRGSTYEVGQKVGRMKGETKELRDGLSELIQAIDDYYITPSYSGRLTVGELDFTKSRGAKLIATGMARLGVQNVTGQAYSRLLDKTFVVPPRAIKVIMIFLEEVLAGGGELGRDLIRKGEAASTALAKIFGGGGESISAIEERNDNHFAAIIAYLFEAAGMAEGEIDAESKEGKKEVLGEKKFKGKTLAEREEDYTTDYNSGKAFPLFALPTFLNMYKEDIARSPRTKEGLNELIALLDEIEELPVVMKSLLKAHDVMRIMKNEKIVVAYRPRNISNYDEVITKMFVEQNIDLSYSEVDKIVTEVNSFASIAKSLGLSEEIVYQVKAQFR